MGPLRRYRHMVLVIKISPHKPFVGPLFRQQGALLKPSAVQHADSNGPMHQYHCMDVVLMRNPYELFVCLLFHQQVALANPSAV
jgi:hypothetical protein